MIKSALCVVVVAFLAQLFLEFVLRKEFPVHSTGAVIISGTSSGIGLATCGWLAERYTQVTFYCGVRSPVQGHPFDLPNVQQVTLSITNQEDVDAVIQQILENQKPLIGIINNAGAHDLDTFEFMGVDKLRETLEVNVIGSYRLTQAALPLLRANKGRIVTVGSLMGLIPGAPRFTAYQASKYALEAMFDALRVEVAPYDVSVSLIEPGTLPSKIVESSIQTMKEDSIKSKSPQATEEMKVYQHVIGETYQNHLMELASFPGDMDETCQCMEDAIFGKYPKTRYITSRMGPYPAWLVVKIFRALPARLVDIVMMRLEVLVEQQRALIFAKKLLEIYKKIM